MPAPPIPISYDGTKLNLHIIVQAVDKVIEFNSDDDPRNDISFVVVSGDLIQGEARDDGTWKGENDYRLEYEQIKTQFERLKAPPPAGAGIHYIPLIGNHDVWFNFDFGTWQWLSDHLAECAAAGIEDVIVFTHHPPIYQIELEEGNPPVLTVPSPGVAPTASPAQIKGEAHILLDPGGTLTGKTLSSLHPSRNTVRYHPEPRTSVVRKRKTNEADNILPR